MARLRQAPDRMSVLGRRSVGPKAKESERQMYNNKCEAMRADEKDDVDTMQRRAREWNAALLSERVAFKWRAVLVDCSLSMGSEGGWDMG